MSRSDFKCLEALVIGTESLSALEIYKACAGVANNGQTRNEETALTRPERDLLEIRRLMKQLQLDAAQERLSRMVDLDLICEGDRLFLLGNILHRQGAQSEASRLMRNAAEQYARAGDEHRHLRAVANSLICVSSLETCNVGELHAIEQRARRAGHHDIVGTIQRTRAIELLRTGKAAEASAEAFGAVRSYELDGCPEDKAVAVCLSALSLSVAGDSVQAKDTRNRILVTDGKVRPYLETLDAHLSGRVATVQAVHPLAGIEWKKFALKSGSVLGKIVDRLKKSPATRDELIREVWGERALHPSYNHRLHSALNTLKNRTSFRVDYDGSQYRLH